MVSSPTLPCAKLLTDFEGVRRFLLDKVKDVPAREAMALPAGSKVNLQWHIGHLLYVQSSVLLIRAGDPSPIPKAYRSYFGNGTTAAGFDSLVPDWDELLGRAEAFSAGLVEAHASRASKPLKKPFQLMNIEVNTVGEAIPFLIAHEGDHLGQVKRLLSLLAK
jgi:uncharacterized damage-inducible protein DinB